MKRNWKDVEVIHPKEDSICLVCGVHGIEWAHIVKRERDGRDENGRRNGSTIWVDPRRIAPLCPEHHRLFDDGELDLLPHLIGKFDDKIVEAVRALGLMGACRRLVPSEYGFQGVANL